MSNLTVFSTLTRVLNLSVIERERELHQRILYDIANMKMSETTKREREKHENETSKRERSENYTQAF